MKSKIFKFFLIMTLILQIFVISPVFVKANTTTNSVNIDFSDENAVYDVSNVTAGICDYEILGGQYGKAPNDKSIRLYSVGGSAAGVDSQKKLKIEDETLPLVTEGEYTHLSYQYLNEDGYSILGVNLGYYLPDNETKKYDKFFMTQPRTATILKQIRFMPKANSALNFNASNNGIWHQVDIYFSPSSVENVTLFIDGNKYEKDFQKERY